MKMAAQRPPWIKLVSVVFGLRTSGKSSRGNQKIALAPETDFDPTLPPPLQTPRGRLIGFRTDPTRIEAGTGDRLSVTAARLLPDYTAFQRANEFNPPISQEFGRHCLGFRLSAASDFHSTHLTVHIGKKRQTASISKIRGGKPFRVL
jgi:hypothetical protein